MQTSATASTSKSDIPKTSKPSSSKCDKSESNSNEKTSDNNGTTGSFECNICLDSARDAVVSMCGHLFCWPCLHRWLETAETRTVCPVCKAAISRDKTDFATGIIRFLCQVPRDSNLKIFDLHMA
ncbi:unnamed protein product [Trichobilharzia regenti]|nr:unnamed protein product [Trichobilharzia regenti]